MKDYRMEIWITAICFVLVFLLGGALSSIFVLGIDFFFVEVNGLYEATSYILGFPQHYFLMVVLSWIGATIIGIIWSLAMDKLEEKQNS